VRADVPRRPGDERGREDQAVHPDRSPELHEDERGERGHAGRDGERPEQVATVERARQFETTEVGVLARVHVRTVVDHKVGFLGRLCALLGGRDDIVVEDVRVPS